MEFQFLYFQNTDIGEDDSTNFQISWHNLQSNFGRVTATHYSNNRYLLVSYNLDLYTHIVDMCNVGFSFYAYSLRRMSL